MIPEKTSVSEWCLHLTSSLHDRALIRIYKWHWDDLLMILQTEEDEQFFLLRNIILKLLTVRCSFSQTDEPLLLGSVPGPFTDLLPSS